MSGPVEEVGERVVRMFLTVLESPATGPGFRALLRGALANDLSARLLREFFTRQVVRRLTAALDSVVPAAEMPTRASLVASQIFGMVLMRYLIGLEPIASMGHDEVVAAVAPTVQRYLIGDLTWPDQPCPCPCTRSRAFADRGAGTTDSACRSAFAPSGRPLCCGLAPATWSCATSTTTCWSTWPSSPAAACTTRGRCRSRSRGRGAHLSRWRAACWSTSGAPGRRSPPSTGP